MINPDLKNIERLAFFDVDQTLSNSIDHAFVSKDDIDHMGQWLKDNDIQRIRPVDALFLLPTSVRLFAELMKCENTKAVCISAWAVTDKKEKVIKEIETLFSSLADFPDNWLIALKSGSCGDRVEHAVTPFMEQHNFTGEFVVIDDSGDRFSRQEHVVSVDGRLGFNIYDFVKSCDILNIEKTNNDVLNYQLKQIRKG